MSYHFVGREGFMGMIRDGALLEWAEVHGELYGTSREELERARGEGSDLVLDIDVQGAAQVRREAPDAVSVFLLPPSYESLERRLRSRGLDDETTVINRALLADNDRSRVEMQAVAKRRAMHFLRSAGVDVGIS